MSILTIGCERYPGPPALKLSAGDHHLAVLYRNGQALISGYNFSGELGRVDLEPQTIPTPLDIDNIVDISCGRDHTGLITKDHQVFLCGRAMEGQLGRMGLLMSDKFLLLPDIKGKRIVCGNRNTAVIDTEDRLWMFGEDWEGQCGGPPRSYPTLHPRLVAEQVSSVALGDHFTVILSSQVARTIGDQFVAIEGVDSIFARGNRWGYLSHGEGFQIVDGFIIPEGKGLLSMDWSPSEVACRFRDKTVIKRGGEEIVCSPCQAAEFLRSKLITLESFTG